MYKGMSETTELALRLDAYRTGGNKSSSRVCLCCVSQFVLTFGFVGVFYGTGTVL
jgi:hypothetical protein